MEATMSETDQRLLLLASLRSLREFMRRQTSNDEDAEDLAQDLAVLVLAERGGRCDHEKFAVWCRGVARNVVAHQRRAEMRRRRRMESSKLEWGMPPDSCEDPEGYVMMREELVARVDGLDSGGRSLLRDRFILEETSAEIATRAHVSAAAVRMRIARLLVSLRAAEPKSELAPVTFVGSAGP
jgi:RNA polymerase sigma factor (sigma-70 family)